ncbi:MAG: dihydroorotate dehydrogenase [Elusimicrobia bacterium CG06_land_8_20_14_3_00_38_11]|nr:MAG: dihydroorotate dehydrogenase [Elusimicrobia bacterium CG06_land_8_20_14_3_00_38_11]
MIKICVSIGKLKLKNPVMVASGTFGYGIEYKDLVDLDKLGAIITKTITLKPRKGNPQPRIFELPYGMINSVGLQNVGLKKFIEEKLLSLKKNTKTPIIVSIGGKTKEEFVKITEVLDSEKIGGIELNISCPNIIGGKIISQSPKETYKLVSSIRKKTSHTLITKLSPNVTDITEIAESVEDAGSDAVSLINSFPAMIFPQSLNIPYGTSCGRSISQSPVFGGLSGPCIKHIALKMVYQAARAVKIPVIGMGGITGIQDALDFFNAGAKAMAVGCANFIDLKIVIKIIDELEKY